MTSYSLRPGISATEWRSQCPFTDRSGCRAIWPDDGCGPGSEPTPGRRSTGWTGPARGATLDEQQQHERTDGGSHHKRDQSQSRAPSFDGGPNCFPGIRAGPNRVHHSPPLWLCRTVRPSDGVGLARDTARRASSRALLPVCVARRSLRGRLLLRGVARGSLDRPSASLLRGAAL